MTNFNYFLEKDIDGSKLYVIAESNSYWYYRDPNYSIKHKLGGPAVVHAPIVLYDYYWVKNSTIEYWLFGKQYSKEDFKNKVKKLIIFS